MKNIYFFEEGNKEMKNILGQKGANLCEMYNMCLPVPYGFIIRVDSNIKEIEKEIVNSLLKLKGTIGKDLFLSVRSSAPISMPGMMDTILNVSSCEQLIDSIKLVLNSWNNRRAKIYREVNNISDNFGTAVVIQEMVFGNKNDNSSTGVIFSRNPNNFDDKIFGEIIFNAQGNDIVSGLVTPVSIENLDKGNYLKLSKISKDLENHFGEIQEIEFTIEDNELFILQTRNVKKVKKKEMYKIKNKPSILLSSGIPSSYGSAHGKVVFDSTKAVQLKSQGENVILVRLETSPEDIDGIYACDGIVTLSGGSTSHAAVVSRSIGKPCVCGCEKLKIKELEWITIDGTMGEVFLGKYELIKITDDNIKY